MNIIEASAVLRISVPFTLVQLLAAYRREAMTRHPDRGGSDDLFRELTLAYDFMRPLALASVVDSDGPKMTVHGVPLSDLGRGFPLTKSARTCDRCGGAGYNIEENHSGASIECPKCVGHGVISHPCRRCDGTGKMNGKECYTCHGSGRFFPHVTDKEIKDGVSYDKRERHVIVQASAKLPNVHGRVCFECDSNGRIDYETDWMMRNWFGGMWGLRDRRKTTGMEHVELTMKRENCSRAEAQKMLGFRALTTRTTYFSCSVCHGVGEVEMFNPVLPRGLLSVGGR